MFILLGSVLMLIVLQIILQFQTNKSFESRL
jgi:hypothetical protein